MSYFVEAEWNTFIWYCVSYFYYESVTFSFWLSIYWAAPEKHTSLSILPLSLCMCPPSIFKPFQSYLRINVSYTGKLIVCPLWSKMVGTIRYSILVGKCHFNQEKLFTVWKISVLESWLAVYLIWSYVYESLCVVM